MEQFKKFSTLKGKFKKLSRFEKQLINGGQIECKLTSGQTVRWQGSGSLLDNTVQCVKDYGNLCGYCYDTIAA